MILSRCSSLSATDWFICVVVVVVEVVDDWAAGCLLMGCWEWSVPGRKAFARCCLVLMGSVVVLVVVAGWLGVVTFAWVVVVEVVVVVAGWLGVVTFACVVVVVVLFVIGGSSKLINQGLITFNWFGSHRTWGPPVPLFSLFFCQ